MVSSLAGRTRVWGNRRLLTSVLATRKAVTLYCELAPTGPIHLGILRMLVQMDILRSELVCQGVVVSMIIRINDRYSVRRGSYGATDATIGRSILDINDPDESAKSIYSKSLSDLQRAVAALNIQVHRWIKVSDLYADSAFQEKIWLAWRERESVEQILRRHADRFDQIIFPRCDNCRRCYLTKIEPSKNSSTYQCTCGFSGHVSRDLNGGLISFKIENAIVWEHLGVDVDFHGADHFDAAQASCEVLKVLFSRECPMNFVVNLTLGSDGKVMRKSRRNFRSIVEYKGDLPWMNLVELLARVPVNLLWRPSCPLRLHRTSSRSIP